MTINESAVQSWVSARNGTQYVSLTPKYDLEQIGDVIIAFEGRLCAPCAPRNAEPGQTYRLIRLFGPTYGAGGDLWITDMPHSSHETLATVTVPEPEVVGPTVADMKFREAAETLAPIFAAQGWEWVGGATPYVPDADQIEFELLRLYESLDDACRGSGCGRLDLVEDDQGAVTISLWIGTIFEDDLEPMA